MIHKSTWAETYKGEVKTLHLRRDPFLHGLGHYTDISGVRWDIYATIGKSFSKTGRAFVNARRIAEEGPDRSTTAFTESIPSTTSTDFINRWAPYYVEVVE